MQKVAVGPKPIVKAEHILYVTFAEYATIEAAKTSGEIFIDRSCHYNRASHSHSGSSPGSSSE